MPIPKANPRPDLSVSKGALVDHLLFMLNGSSLRRSVVSLPNVACSAGTTQGLVRQQNEDRVFIMRGHLQTSSETPFLMFAVADGMGGMVDGTQCARMALASFSAYLLKRAQNLSSETLSQAVEAANLEIHRVYRSTGGSTLTALIVEKQGSTWLVHVGDSRAYCFKPGQIETFRQLTIDDTLQGHRPTIAVRGGTQDRDRQGLIQYMGMGEDLNPHVIDLSCSILSSAVLLTTDGAHGVGNTILSQLAVNCETATELTLRLLDISEWIGGYDNASVISIYPETITRFHNTKTTRGTYYTAWTPLGQYDVLVPGPQATFLYAEDSSRLLFDHSRPASGQVTRVRSQSKNIRGKRSNEMTRKQRRQKTKRIAKTGQFAGQRDDEREPQMKISLVPPPEDEPQ